MSANDVHIYAGPYEMVAMALAVLCELVVPGFFICMRHRRKN